MQAAEAGPGGYGEGRIGIDAAFSISYVRLRGGGQAAFLNPNDRLAAGASFDARTLSAIKMPNRSMFVGDPRPEVKNPACMTGC